MNIKGLEGYLTDDPGLTRKVTYEGHQNGRSENKDHSLEEAFDEYRKMIEEG